MPKKPEKEYSEFKRLVLGAYEEEYGFRRQTQIAEVLGLTPSGINKVLRTPEKLKRDTVRRITGGLSREAHKDEIRAAWFRAIGEEVPIGDTQAVEDDPWDSFVRLSKENKPEAALAAARRVDWDVLTDENRFVLLLQWLSLCFRMDKPGEAIVPARRFVAWGETSNSRDRVLAGLAATARAMRVAGFPEREAARFRSEAGLLVDSMSPEELARPAGSFARETLESEILSAMIKRHEMYGDQAEKLSGKMRIAEERAARATTSAGKIRALQLQALISVGLGEFGRAEEAVGEAMKLADEHGSSRAVFLQNGIVLSQALAGRGEKERARRLLGRICDLSVEMVQPYVHRLAQTEILRLERPDVATATLRPRA